MSQHSTDKHYECLPAAADGAIAVGNGVAFANSAYAQITAGEAGIIHLCGVHVLLATATTFEIDVATGGAGSETVIATFRGRFTGPGGWQWPIRQIIPKAIAASTRVAVRVRLGNTTTGNQKIKIWFLRQ